MRIDIVFDVYKVDSRNQETQETRKKNEGVRISIKETLLIYRESKQVLYIAENNTKLFNLAIETLMEIFVKSQVTLLCINHISKYKWCI